MFHIACNDGLCSGRAGCSSGGSKRARAAGSQRNGAQRTEADVLGARTAPAPHAAHRRLVHARLAENQLTASHWLVDYEGFDVASVCFDLRMMQMTPSRRRRRSTRGVARCRRPSRPRLSAGPQPASCRRRQQVAARSSSSCLAACGCGSRRREPLRRCVLGACTICRRNAYSDAALCLVSASCIQHELTRKQHHQAVATR